LSLRRCALCGLGSTVDGCKTERDENPTPVPKLWPHRRKTLIATAEIELIGYKKY
jgi:hypothetical protein